MPIAGYKVVTIPRKSPVRPYRQDMLTRQPNGGNWIVQFRVPEHHRGIPPYGNKVIFKRTTGTKNYKDACEFRDQLLTKIGFMTDGEVRDHDRRSAKMRPMDHYFDTLSLPIDAETATTLKEEVASQLQDLSEEGEGDASTDKLRLRLQAQLAALDRKVEADIDGESAVVDAPHPFTLTLAEACKNLAKARTEAARPAKSVAKITTAASRLTAFIGSDPVLNSIRRLRVRAYIRHCRDAGISRATVGNDLSYLAQAFKNAIDDGYLSEAAPNPFYGHVVEGFQPRVFGRPFNADQLGKILLSVRGDHDVLAATLIGYYTGMRLDEVFTSTRAERSATPVWEVAFQGGKTANATRLIPIHPSLVSALERLGKYPELGMRISWAAPSSDALGKRFGRAKKAVVEEAGLDQEGFGFHSLRHGFATQLRDLDHSEADIALLMGHSRQSVSSTETGRTYLQPRAVAVRKAIIESIPELTLPVGLLPPART